MRQMSAKDLHIAIKRQDGMAYLQKRFGIDTREALFDMIRRIVPDHCEYFIKELTKNQRKKRTHIISQPDQVVETIASESQEPETVEPFELEFATTQKEKNAMRLEELLKEEEEMSTALCLLEGLHKELASKRHSIRSALEHEKATLIRLREESARREKNVLQLHAQYMSCANEMYKLNTDMRAYEELLVEVREAIEVEQRIVVQVYDTGIIVLENAEFPEIAEDQIKEQFDMLLSLSEAEELTIKCVKSVAKLRVMMKKFPDAELIFESDAMKTLYEA